MIGDGEGYQRLRGAFASMIGARIRALLPLTTYVGGIYTSRSHKGDPNAEMPYRPLAAAEQRAAVDVWMRQEARAAIEQGPLPDR